MDDQTLARRRFLALTGSAGALALAGCSGASDGSDGGSTSPTPTDTTGGSSQSSADSLGDETWTQYRFDAGNAGHAQNNTGPGSKPSSRWEASVGGAVETSPVRANGTVYVGGADGVLYAFDEVDGTEQWTFDTAGSLRTPAVGDGTVYVTNEDGWVYGVTAADGAKQWQYQIGATLQPPTVADGTVYAGGEQGLLVALSTDGSEAWTYRVGQPITAPVVVVGNRVIVGTEKTSGPTDPTGTVWWLTIDGDLGPYLPGFEGAVVDLAGTNGLVLAADKHGTVYGLRTKYKGSAESLWSNQVAGTGQPLAALTGGTAYATRGQFVSAIEPSDGSVRWKSPPDVLLESAPAVVDGTAYLGHESGLYAVTVADGTLAWQFDHGSAIGPPAIANGTIAVGSADGTVSLLE
ncbi:PQQ-binding-like beta-propeller repeat protein [Halobacteriales archaeon Cl-PHB]